MIDKAVWLSQNKGIWRVIEHVDREVNIEAILIRNRFRNGPIFSFSRRQRNSMLFLGLPRNQGVTERNKISSERGVSNRETGPIRVTLYAKLKISIWVEKDTLSRGPFIYRRTWKVASQCSWLHELRKNMDRICQVETSNSKIDQAADKVTISIRRRQEWTSGLT